MKTILVLTNRKVYSPDKMFAGQAWKRASFLTPVPCPQKWREALHEASRRWRNIWPVWIVYAVSGQRLGVVWATGQKLTTEELRLNRGQNA